MGVCRLSGRVLRNVGVCGRVDDCLDCEGGNRMSVYIPGMEMPKSCHECVAGYGGCCFVAPAESDGICPDHGRADFCPLIPVPDHGRLIDADALITKVTDAAIKQPEIADVYYEQASEIGGWLYSMPTIIPADKDGE